MTDKQIIIEDCPYFIGGCCQEYLDGVCENHKCDLKIIRELEQKLKAKEQELNDYKKQFKADTKEMEDYQNEIVRHLESIEYWQHQAEIKEQECEELKKRVYKYEQAEKYPAAFLWQEGLL